MSKPRTTKRMADKPEARSLAVIRNNLKNTPHVVKPQPLEEQQRQHLSSTSSVHQTEDLQRQVNQYRDQLRVSTARQIDMLSRQLKDAMLQTKDPDKFDKIVRLIDETYTRSSGLL